MMAFLGQRRDLGEETANAGGQSSCERQPRAHASCDLAPLALHADPARTPPLGEPATRAAVSQSAHSDPMSISIASNGSTRDVRSPRKVVASSQELPPRRNTSSVRLNGLMSQACLTPSRA